MGQYGGRYALSQCKGPQMRLTDISLNWLLPGAVLLLGMLAAVAVLARGKRSGEHAKTEDSWERSEERRRRKESLYGLFSYILLFCCAAVAAALSFRGLVGFGEQNLGLTDGWQYLVPFGLDGAAMFCSVSPTNLLMRSLACLINSGLSRLRAMCSASAVLPVPGAP